MSSIQKRAARLNSKYRVEWSSHACTGMPPVFRLSGYACWLTGRGAVVDRAAFRILHNKARVKLLAFPISMGHVR